MGGIEEAESVTGITAAEISTEEHEEPEALGGADVDEQLPAGSSSHHEHHVEAEDRAPGLVRGAVVEPTFEHDEDTGVAEAADQVDERPTQGCHDDGVDEYSGGGGGRERGKHPDVADGRECSGDELGADEVAGEVESHDHAHRARTDAFCLPADGEEDPLEAVTDLVEDEGEEECPDARDRRRGAGRGGPVPAQRRVRTPSPT